MIHAFECCQASVSVGGKTLLQPVDQVFKPGEFVVIIGPNGAGKSTLLKLLCGDHTAQSGQVTYDDQPLSEWPLSTLAHRRAVMAQSSALSFPFSVLEVVRLGARMSAKSHQEASERAKAALRKVDLNGYGRRNYQDLSGGEQQRVMLARTLCQVWEPVANDIPRFLFLDEPTSSLDIRHQIDILTIAKNFVTDGGGCVAVLHDLNLAAMFADRILALGEGKILADGKPGEVLNDQLMKDIFQVPLRVNRAPSARMSPFVLPQSTLKTQFDGPSITSDHHA